MKYFMMAAMFIACGDKEDSAEPEDEAEQAEEEAEEQEEAE